MTNTRFFTHVDSPIGRLCLQSDGQHLTALYTPGHARWHEISDAWQHDDGPFTTAREQLEQYFAGQRQTFNLPTRPSGTPFQQSVWTALTHIPYGVTMTYAQLADQIGNPKACRAVGNANGRNPISIIIPCHRVIGTQGHLTGYAGGLANKQWLLELERSGHC